MEINIWQILFQAINFGLLLFILNKFLYKPILNALNERAKKINEGLLAADKNIKGAEEMEKSKKLEITKARKEAQAIIREAEAEAKKKADSIVAEAKLKAKKEAEKILLTAEGEKAQALKEIDKQASKIAVIMAKKALSETLSAKEVETITTKLIAKLG